MLNHMCLVVMLKLLLGQLPPVNICNHFSLEPPMYLRYVVQFWWETYRALKTLCESPSSQPHGLRTWPAFTESLQLIPVAALRSPA